MSANVSSQIAHALGRPPALLLWSLPGALCPRPGGLVETACGFTLAVDWWANPPWEDLPA